MVKILSNRRVIFLFVILIVSNLIITGVSLYVSYAKSVATLKATLIDIVERQKSMVTVLHEHGKTEVEIIKLISAMRDKHYVIGTSGEFAIAENCGDSIHFLFASGINENYKISNANGRGLPARMALTGKSGFINCSDYKGVNVFAAYTYAEKLGWGIVAKIPSSEVNQPYFEAIAIAFAISLLLLTLCIFLFVKISRNILQSLIDSERKYRSLVETAQELVWRCDENGCFTYLNPAWEQTHGYTLDEMLGKSFGCFQKPEVFERDMREFARHMVGGFVKEYETTQITKDGRELTLLFNAIPLFGPTGSVIGTQGTAIDITHRKFAEHLLKEKNEEYKQNNNQLLTAKEHIEESERSYKQIFDSTGTANSIFDNKCVLRLQNKLSQEILGFGENDGIGKTVFEVFGEKAGKAVFERMNRVINTGVSEVFETEFDLPTGKNWFRSTYQPIVDENNNVISVQVISQNITEKKLAQLELIASKERAKESEAYITTLLQSINDVVVSRNIDNEVVYFNHAFDIATQKLFNRNALAGMNTLKLLSPEAKEFWENVLLKVKNGETSIEEYAFISPDKKRNYYVTSHLPIYQGTKIIGTIEVTKDITTFKDKEIELQTAKDKAEESNRLKTAFLQNMSHEVRTPMNAILGFSEMLVKQFDDKVKLEQYTTIIKERCHDLLAVINDVLEIAKLESGQVSIREEQCNLYAFFDELTKMFNSQRKRIEKHYIEFTLKTECDPNANVVLIDYGKLKQIFVSLIGNAFKFTESGSITGGCKLDDNNNMIFYVSDTGIGIPADKYNVIFERFTQLDQGNNRLYGGNGLGLSIVKALVEMLDGQIWIESELGKGTSFFFTFPCKAVKPEQTQLIGNKEPEQYNFADKTILIVEDDLNNAEFLSIILADTGITMLLAELGSEAIEMALYNDVDMILMDIRLPDMDGYEVTRQIRKNKPNVKIIAQTAYSTSDDRLKALDAGCNNYISKPVSHNALLAMMNKLFQK